MKQNPCIDACLEKNPPTSPSNPRSFMRALGPRLLLSLLLILPGPAFSLNTEIQLPDMGDPADTVLTPSSEVRLGRAFINSVRERQKFVDEPVYEDYIETLGNKIAANSDDPGHAFNFYLIESPVVNAFAGPGGHIAVYSGLVLTTQSESELAAVVSHEIAHVTQKHLLRTFYRAQQMSVPAAVALLAAVLIGVGGGGGDLTRAAVAGIQGGMLQDQINYTRHNEEEADRVGMETLVRTRFDPRSMPAFFGRMGKASQAYSTKLPEFLRTHPVTTNRIGDALGRAEKYPYRQHSDDIRYHLLRSWLKLRDFPQPGKAVDYFSNNLREGRYNNKDAEEFGLALALMQKRQYDQARPILSRLLQGRPQTVEYRLALADLEAVSDRPTQALNLIQEGRMALPENKPLALGQAELLQKQGNYKQAATVLSKLAKEHPDDPRLLLLLSRAEGKNGHRADAHGHLAEHYYLNGELKAAIYQLEIALREPAVSDFQAAKFAARLRTLKQEYVEQETLRKQH
ncbi:MAG: M48 family metalloprotease [Gammaproteobacteria bacterium]|nr:M48 family metalloprotease [Gammaproteobacteria bacterium]MBU1655637.1 M48 family metalloprotease [Gammaproteobacteria bacterium]MBU1960290.1 M48 family metalloprotease [Gammaproteobacteria bacterium]